MVLQPSLELLHVSAVLLWLELTLRQFLFEFRLLQLNLQLLPTA